MSQIIKEFQESQGYNINIIKRLILIFGLRSAGHSLILSRFSHASAQSFVSSHRWKEGGSCCMLSEGRFHTHSSPPLQPPLEGALLDVFGAGFSVWPICCFAAAHASMSLPPSVFAPANWLLVRRPGPPGAHSFWLWWWQSSARKSAVTDSFSNDQIGLSIYDAMRRWDCSYPFTNQWEDY